MEDELRFDDRVAIVTGGGKSAQAADSVVEKIKAFGGEAVANHDSVEDGAKFVQTVLRDTSFKKMSPEDWDLIHRVHVLGAYRVTAAAWSHMQDAGDGRVLFTESATGLDRNFGQEKNVRVNTIAPIAASRMTETILPPQLLESLKPEYVSPLVAWLAHESCEGA